VVAAPIFHRIADAALRQIGVRPTVDPLPPVVVSGETLIADEERAPAVVPASVSGAPVMPDLAGLSARDAVRALTSVGMTARVSGTGVVVHQSPDAGSALDRGGWAAIDLQPSVSPATAGPRGGR